MDRRTSIQWMLAAAASMPLLQQRVWGGGRRRRPQLWDTVAILI